MPVVLNEGNVPALARGLALLRFLGTRSGPIPAATIARELGLPRSTVYHLLTVLQADGFVVHLPEERAYGLGVSVFELGSAYLRHDPIERLARPLLHRLVDRLGETVHLGVLHGNETLYLSKETPRGSVPLVTDIGVRLPAHLTAVGRAMLAQLPRSQVRALYPSAASFVDRTGLGPKTPGALRELLAAEATQGWSVEDGQVTEFIASVAATAFDHGGRPVAAIGVTFAADRHPTSADRRLLAGQVSQAAASLTRRLSGSRSTPKLAAEMQGLPT